MTTEGSFDKPPSTNAYFTLEKTWRMFGGSDGKQVTQGGLESLLQAALRVAELQDRPEQLKKAQDLKSREGITTALEWLNQQSSAISNEIIGYGIPSRNPIRYFSNKIRRALSGYVPPEFKELSRRSQACLTASLYLVNQIPNK